MRETPKIVSLASALAALAAPAAAPPIADAAESDGAQISTEAGDGIQAETEMAARRTELMSFTVHQISDGIDVPAAWFSLVPFVALVACVACVFQPGVRRAVLPYVPDTAGFTRHQFTPPPVVAPPAATTSPTTTPPPPAADPAYLACTRASNGFGVNDIASELEQVFGIAANEAVNIAQQALTAVLAGGHYCDGYLGDHQ